MLPSNSALFFSTPVKEKTTWWNDCFQGRRGRLMRDVEKRCDDVSSRSCRCLIRPHVKFATLTSVVTRLMCSVPSLLGFHGSPFQKAQNKPIFNTVYLKQTLDIRMSSARIWRANTSLIGGLWSRYWRRTVSYFSWTTLSHSRRLTVGSQV